MDRTAILNNFRQMAHGNLGIPLMLAEFGVGRRGQRGPIGSLRKLGGLGLVQSVKRGKEAFYSVTDQGRDICLAYRDVREACLMPGFSDEEMGTSMLKDGDMIEDTKSAIVLEDLIGKFLYSQSSPATDTPATKE